MLLTLQLENVLFIMLQTRKIITDLHDANIMELLND